MILWVCVRAQLAVLDTLGMDKALINRVCVCVCRSRWLLAGKGAVSLFVPL